ncbi:hypothetical protein FKM82_028908 [Ascaphus truei]
MLRFTSTDTRCADFGRAYSAGESGATATLTSRCGCWKNLIELTSSDHDQTVALSRRSYYKRTQRLQYIYFDATSHRRHYKRGLTEEPLITSVDRMISEVSLSRLVRCSSQIRKRPARLRSGEEWRCHRLALNREVLSVAGVARFLPLLDQVGQDFVRRAYTQVERSGRGKWTADLSNELFRFALESVCYVLYGQRLGLLQDYIDPEAQKFIDSVTLMFHTTAPMLYLPPRLLRGINSRIWTDHVRAWDAIFNHADSCIQGIYGALKQRSDSVYSGVLSSLLLQEQLPLEDIKASVTELMAGGVDTTSMTLQWAMFELARSPGVQERLRSEVTAAREAYGSDLTTLLKNIPLVKAAVKETLRLHPVAITLQRYTQRETVIQNYLIPQGTLVQVGLYAGCRNPDIFPSPERFSLRAGWQGSAMEMQLFLVHILENFKIEVNRMSEVGTTFNLILFPSKPIPLTLRPLK